jgi:hypothetical protein
MSESRKKFYLQGGIHPMLGKKHSLDARKKNSEANSGAKSSKWKGGRRPASNGYVWVYSPSHPFKSCQNRVLEHRLVMEKKLGRFLTKKEVVHHINGIRDDNRIENLVITTASVHAATHNKERIWKEASKEKQRIKTEKMKRNEKGRFVRNGSLPTTMVPGGALPFINVK